MKKRKTERQYVFETDTHKIQRNADRHRQKDGREDRKKGRTGEKMAKIKTGMQKARQKQRQRERLFEHHIVTLTACKLTNL